jgi:hypothetical protein
MRYFKLLGLICPALPTQNISNHKLVLCDDGVFALAKTKIRKSSYYGTIGHYNKLRTEKKDNLEKHIALSLKRHNGHRLVKFHDGLYRMIYPGNTIIIIGSSHSEALTFWYDFWKK